MKKMVEKVLAVALITNLSVLNTAAVSKSVVSATIEALEKQEISVNQTNILFDAFLKNNESAVHEMNVKIGEVNKLYVSIGIHTEGVLNGGIIKLTDSNMKFDTSMEESIYVKSVSENEIELNQLRYGENIEIEIPVIFVEKENVSISYMEKSNKIVLEGMYKEDENEEKISSEILVKMNYTEEADVNVNTSFEKNTALGNGKILVEQVIESSIVNNKLPKEEETVIVNVPEIEGMKPESVSVLVNDVKLEEGYTYNEEELLLEIANNKEENGSFDWTGKEDVYKVVYTYASTVGLEAREIENTVEVSTKVLTMTDEVQNEISETQNVGIIGNIIDVETKSQTPSKGYMYSKTENTEYQELIKVNVSSAEDESEIEIEGVNTKLVLEDENTIDISGKVGYKDVTVNKEELLELVGEDGFLKIVDQEGTTITEITKNSSTNDEGNVVVNIPNAASNIKIVASKLVKEGTIEVLATRVIAKDLGISTEVLKQAVAIQEEKVVNQNKAILTVNLSETVTEALIQMNTTSFTTAEENKDIQMVVNFNTSSNEYDLFKNPTIRVKMPEEIKSVTVNKSEIAYTDELKVAKIYADGRDLIVEIEGEQTTYTEETILGPALVLDFNVILNANAARQETEISIEYTNENAKKYSNKQTQTAINITTPKDLTLINNIEGLGIETSGIEEETSLKLEGEKQAITTTNEIEVVNNYAYDLEVTKVMGLLGNDTTSDTNSLGIKILSEVKVSGVEKYNVYYTSNENATDDLQNQNNNWSSNIQGATKYMVVAEDFETSSNMIVSYDMEIPANLADGLEANLGYDVIYGNANVTNTMTSTDITLITNEAANISVNLSATVGNEAIGETVKQNEVITYTAVVKNEGQEDRTDVKLVGLVPEGTKLYLFDGDSYNESDEFQDAEIPETYMNFYTTDDKELIETIDLKAGQEVTIKYDVKIDSDVELNKEILNTFKTECNGVTSSSNEVSTKVLQANLDVTIKRRTNMIAVAETNASLSYYILVENKSESVLTNIVINNPFEAFGTIENVSNVSGNEFIENNGVVTLEELNAGEEAKMMYTVKCKIDNVEEEIQYLIADVTASGEKYISNVWSENVNVYGASIEAIENEVKEVKSGDTVIYEYLIKNTAVNTIEELKFATTLSNEISAQKIYIDDEEIELSNNYINKTMQLEDEIRIKIEATVIEYSSRTEDTLISGIATIYNGNVLLDTSKAIEHIIKVEEEEEGLLARVETADVKLSSNAGSIVSNGDKITYTYNISNTGNVEIYAAKLKATVPSELTVEKITLDGNDFYVENNQIEIAFSLVNDVELKIETVVNSNTAVAKTFVNEATVYIEEKEIGKSNQIIQTIINGDYDDSGNDNSGNDNSEVSTNSITGLAWLDANEDGLKSSGETTLSGINVKAVNVDTNQYATLNGSVVQATTDTLGNYSMALPEGNYILVFDYDSTKYKLSKYKIDEQKLDSDVFENEININGTTEVKSITDMIMITGSDVSGVDIGLIENQIFDMEMDKYVSKIILKDDNGTVTKEYDRQTLVKLEIDKNTIDSTEAIIEYEIVVSNVGEVSGYVKSIIDYLPSDLEFNSELNSSWYKEGDNIYSNELYNQKINPGEEKTIKLVVTKSLKGSQAGLTTNRAEIFQTENEQGIEDYNSTPGNNKDGENDLGVAEIIFTVGTGSSITNTITIISVAVLSTMAVALAVVGYKKSTKENK